MNTPHVEPDLAPLFAALQAGDPGPVVTAFMGQDGPRTAILRQLLAVSLDRPVADAFSRIWQEITPDMPQERMSLLKWYVSAEAATPHPARRAALVTTLTRLTMLSALPLTEAGGDLGFVAVRAAVECHGPLALRQSAGAFLRRLAADWTRPDSPPLRPSMLLAAIQCVDLTVLRAFLDRMPAGALSIDLQRALDWATGLCIEFAGIDPWLSGVIEREYRRDPHHPAAVQRKAQLGLHLGQTFADLAEMFHGIRFDPKDVSLKPALQFAFWRAENENLQTEAAFLSAHLRTLDPAWTNAAGPIRTEGSAMPGDTLSGLGLAELVDRAADLCSADLDRAGPFAPSTLRAEFDRIATSIAAASLPATWSLAEVLQSVQRLLQIDRREVAWIVHFVDAPHAQGKAQYGSVDLACYPALHSGVMAAIAALCRAGLDWALAGNRVHGNAPIARLAQHHTRACLEIDQTATAQGFLARIEGLGILTDVLAIERDNCRLQQGELLGLRAHIPANRQGSSAHAFLARQDWSRAEGVVWSVLANDLPVAGRFDLIGPDGRLQVHDHQTPPGTVETTGVQGLSLIAEDLLIGPKVNVLRPDTYHTSAEFPWDSAVVVASRKRAIRLRPTSTADCKRPVLVLEAFEALRWRNYYHWMIPILSRVALAKERGLLAGRLLVVPDGLSGWMKDTLGLIGLTAEDLFVAPLGRKVTFTDALLMSSIEHVSSAAVQALRGILLTPDDAPPKRTLFLSRSTQRLRKMQIEAEIEDMARTMGFEVIAPQDYSVAEQVQLFRQARGIAAVEGAALTNTIFCPPGTRVLSMLCLNDMMPIFNDLSIVLGHHHRKLAGPGLVGMPTANRFQPPFAIDLDLARKSLIWAMEG